MIIPDCRYEQQLWQQGFRYVAGVDEAGRGPLAGPVTAGAVMITDPSQIIAQVRDSKLMTARQRELAHDAICKHSAGYGMGLATAQEIDELGINRAVQLAMHRALAALEESTGISLQAVIVDGIRTLPLVYPNATRILAGGLYHYSIAAGSVLAKVSRDRIMETLDTTYPQYGFSHHKGYGTPRHYAAIEQHGPCPEHRMTWLGFNLEK